MSEGLIKRLITRANKTGNSEVVRLLREAADALSRPATAPCAVPDDCDDMSRDWEYRAGWNDCCAAARKLSAAPSAPAVPVGDGWAPIETAPKDGTRIIVAKIGATAGVPEMGIEPQPPHVWWAAAAHWSQKWQNWNDDVEPCGLAGPNAWMQLPSPAIASQEVGNDSAV